MWGFLEMELFSNYVCFYLSGTWSLQMDGCNKNNVKSMSQTSLQQQICPCLHCRTFLFCFILLAKWCFLNTDKWLLRHVYFLVHAKPPLQWGAETTYQVVWKECQRQRSGSSHSLSPTTLGSGPSSPDKWLLPLIHQDFFFINGQLQPDLQIITANSILFFSCWS